MPKKMRNVLSNIFSRNKNQLLESDAVPTGDNNNPETPVDAEEIISSPTSDDNLALALQNEESNVSSMMNLNNPNQTLATNNILAVNNTQGQVIYQFSNIKGLQLGSVFHINTGDKNGSKQQKRVTRTVNEMMKSQSAVSRKMLDCISTHLGQGWQDVMRQLHYSEGQIHQRIVDYKVDGGMKEVMYQLLLEWSSNDDEATLGKITQILWTSGQTETVEYMKKIWKSENHVHPTEKPV